MMFNQNLTREAFEHTLALLYIDTAVDLRTTDKNEIEELQLLVKFNLNPLKLLYAVTDFHRVKWWQKVDITILLLEISNYLQVKLFYNEGFILMDHEKQLLNYE
ncbi:hypothetical protein [Myroides fluvii]|uniref:hypothetical protein n=1 Tax=Myroides fluvii TaxID=2572594 RepID=UPI00131DEC86|nr:hypothetical protein [Myroides fluvii]